MSSVYINDVPLSYAVTATAYDLQKISDMLWVDSINGATKVAEIAAIRHYRASNMMGNKIFIDSGVSFDSVDKDADLEDIIDNFCAIEEIIDEKILALSENSASEEEKDLLISFDKMIKYTRNVLRYSIFLDSGKISLFSDSNFLSKFICIQCGEIHDTDDIGECFYCAAGVNHIAKINEIT